MAKGSRTTKQLSKRNSAQTTRRERKDRLRRRKLFQPTTTAARDIPLARRPCPTPGKVVFANKPAARRALKRHNDFRRDELGRLPKPYKCVCGRYHLGHLPPVVVKGEATRSEIRARKAVA